ncbi:hypothetical protein B0H19DRAFT_583367 [Mycena capillaripes]|nr:hypothetical protein B0H19DRAFT_583367 [Mycena capillaripes]
MSTSNFTLSPASQAFVDTRTTSLGPWVLGAFVDSILMGVIFCQASNYFAFRRIDYGFGRYYTYLVVVVTLLSVLKTTQGILVVWVQNVLQFANPDIARNLVNVAWWQVSVSFLSGIIGSIVQSFFALRYYKLSRNWAIAIPIGLAIILGLAGVSLAMISILTNNAKAKVMWLLVHFVSVFVADLLITSGTCYTLRQRSTGLTSTSSLISRLVRMVFESAIPPTLIATVDLILTQTLGPKLLWHLFVNYSLSKVYVISLLYTLNCISQYRKDTNTRSNDGHVNNRVNSRPGNNVLAPRSFEGNIFVETEVTKHSSPENPITIRDLRNAKTASHYVKSSQGNEYPDETDLAV